MSMDQYRWPDSIRRTRPRLQIWNLLIEADVPLSAADVYARLCAVEEKEARHTSLSSVYRTLELLCEHGLLSRTDTAKGATGAGATGYELAARGHRHYAVCKACNKTVLLPGECPIGPLDALMGEADFRVTEHRLQLYGYCAECLSGNDQTPSPKLGGKK